MKLLLLLLASLALVSLSWAGSGHSKRRGPAKNQRGTRYNPTKHIAHSKRAAALAKYKRSDVDRCTTCTTKTSFAIDAPKENIWAGLSNEEALAVAVYLFDSSEYNLTATANATNWDNTLALVELLQPNKTDALEYADKDGEKPKRYAHAVIDIRSVEEAYILDVVVGPLPVSEKTTVEPLNYPYNSGAGRARNYNPDEDARRGFLIEFATNISDITLDLWGKALLGDKENDTLTIWGIDPLWVEDGRVISWDQFWGVPTAVFDDSTLLPTGLYFKSDITGRDPSKWTIEGILYNDIFYESVAAFRTAYFTPGFEKLGANEDGAWARTDSEGGAPKADKLYPPVQIAPDGGRYGVDEEQQYVEWMDFSFFWGFTRDSGVRLYDIKFKGERILYELGMQEALAHYASNDPTQSGTSYLDTYYGFGPWAFEMLPGFDCPTYSSFHNTTYWTEESHLVHPNSICLFEHDPGYPISRHTSGAYATSTKNIVFTLRTINTVGNYDYM